MGSKGRSQSFVCNYRDLESPSGTLPRGSGPVLAVCVRPSGLSSGGGCSARETALLVVCALALGLCGVLGSVLLLGRLAGTNRSLLPIAGSSERTPHFGEAARFLRLNVNASADPCQDFYTYACGGWLARHRMPEARDSFGLVSAIELENERKLRALLMEGPRSGSATSVAEQKAQEFYRSCMDTAELDRRAGEPLLDEIRTLGGWDVLGLWNQEQWDVHELLFRVHGVYNVPVFFSLIVDVTGENSSGNVIRVGKFPANAE